MISVDDWADIIYKEIILKSPLPSENNKVKSSILPAIQKVVSHPGRNFLSEYDIKKLLKKNPLLLCIPKQTIISPLAQDWLLEKNIKIIYE